MGSEEETKGAAGRGEVCSISPVFIKASQEELLCSCPTEFSMRRMRSCFHFGPGWPRSSSVNILGQWMLRGGGNLELPPALWPPSSISGRVP